MKKRSENSKNKKTQVKKKKNLHCLIKVKTTLVTSMILCSTFLTLIVISPDVVTATRLNRKDPPAMGTKNNLLSSFTEPLRPITNLGSNLMKSFKGYKNDLLKIGKQMFIPISIKPFGIDIFSRMIDPEFDIPGSQWNGFNHLHNFYSDFKSTIFSTFASPALLGPLSGNPLITLSSFIPAFNTIKKAADGTVTINDLFSSTFFVGPGMFLKVMNTPNYAINNLLNNWERATSLHIDTSKLTSNPLEKLSWPKFPKLNQIKIELPKFNIPKITNPFSSWNNGIHSLKTPSMYNNPLSSYNFDKINTNFYSTNNRINGYGLSGLRSGLSGFP